MGCHTFHHILCFIARAPTTNFESDCTQCAWTISTDGSTMLYHEWESINQKTSTNVQRFIRYSTTDHIQTCVQKCTVVLHPFQLLLDRKLIYQERVGFRSSEKFEFSYCTSAPTLNQTWRCSTNLYRFNLLKILVHFMFQTYSQLANLKNKLADEHPGAESRAALQWTAHSSIANRYISVELGEQCWLSLV